MSYGETYMNYLAQEKQKAECWAIMGSETATVDHKARALLGLIEAHYWRARVHLEDRPKSEQRRIHGKRYMRGYELCLDVYTRHWLFANGPGMPAEIVKVCEDVYGYWREESRFLKKGHTSYTLP